MLIICLAIVFATLDQCTKVMVRAYLTDVDSIPVIPGFFDLTYVINTGAAWGILSGWGGWLAALSVVVLVLFVLFRRHLMTDTLLHRVTFGLIMAGILGNLMDRVRLGYVVDFLDFHWRSHHFPAFNVADACICIGVFLYILSATVAAPADETDET